MTGILIICEGKQDVAYISLLLELMGFSEYAKVISDFDQPLQKFFLQQVKGFEYDNNRLRKGPNLPIIYRQLKNHQQFAIVYSIDGLRNIDKAKHVIQNYRTAIEFGLKGSSEMSINLSLCILMDADDVGIEERVNQMKEEYRDTVKNIDEVSHNQVIEEEFYKQFGCYIFSKGEEEKGNLEDILLEALSMNKDFKSKIESGEKFLDAFTFERMVKKKRGKVLDEKKTLSDKKKSIISVSGQFDYSGLDNSDLIRKNKTLKGMLGGHKKSQEIISLFEKLLKSARS